MNPNTPSASNNASQQCFPQAPAYVFYQMPMDQVRNAKYKSLLHLEWQYYFFLLLGFY